jgi:hypothetical protein
MIWSFARPEGLPTFAYTVIEGEPFTRWLRGDLCIFREP